VNSAPGRIPLGGNSPQNVYSVPAQETAKHLRRLRLGEEKKEKRKKKKEEETTKRKYNVRIWYAGRP